MVLPAGGGRACPARSTNVGPLRFYEECVSRAPWASWAWVGALSTVAAFAPACAAKLYHAADEDVMNTLLMLSPVVAVLPCLVIVPGREAYRMYREKDNELAEERRLRAVERKRHVDELESLKGRHEVKHRELADQREQLQKQVNALRADLGRVTIRHQVQLYIKQFEAIDGRTVAGGWMRAQELHGLEHHAKHYLNTHYPAYSGFAADISAGQTFRIEHELGAQAVHERCQNRLAELKEVLTFLDGDPLAL